MKRSLGKLLAGVTAVGLGFFLLAVSGPVPAQDKKTPDAAEVARARDMVKMLDDLYKTAVVSITNHYIEGQAGAPAAVVAQDIFATMQKKGWHAARLVDATGKPRNKANIAKTDFEKKAIQEMKAGKTYYDEVARADGKNVLRAATVVPVVMQQCAVCHSKKVGELLGAIVYEVPIK